MGANKLGRGWVFPLQSNRAAAAWYNAMAQAAPPSLKGLRDRAMLLARNLLSLADEVIE